ncbi:integrase [Microvirga flocculans]|uniref:Integrase n=1 Tax=Microvirga flocculans TaxID=217168 RepID=A0A7W6IHY1_9HYPH|nr:tyrosine-type recombinase/integrase [Microvirga flocculans]MBB4041809.1 integrase [Microvirga flocculans]
MILKMAAPWKHPETGALYLRQRTPEDLVAALKGTTVTLPVGEGSKAVKIGEFVQVSLRTKEPRVAKERHALADAALKEFWRQKRAALAAYPKSDTQKVPVPPLSNPTMKWEVAVERFAPTAADTLRDNGVADTDANRALVVSEVASIMDQVAARLGPHLGKGITGPRTLQREGSGKPSSGLRARPGAQHQVTVEELWNRWSAYQADKRAPATIRRYKPTFDSLAAFCCDQDIQTITGDDIFAWAEQRRDVDGIKPRVINRNDLAAVKSVFGWATTHQGKKLIPSNPAAEIRLDEIRETASRERHFRESEVEAILNLATSVKPCGRNPSFARAKRWCPWLCAYSGARVAEITALHVEDIRQEQGIWVMHFRETKAGTARTVPIHEHLVEQGFLEMVNAIGNGPLFYDPTRHDPDATFGPAEQRAQKLAKWLRASVKLDQQVDPNHGWRHTFKNRALDAGVEERISDAIVGHAPKNVARRYEAPTIRMMARALKRFTRYTPPPGQP